MFTKAGQPISVCCDAVCRGGVQEGTMPLAPLSAGFQSLPPLPTIKLDPSGANSWVGGFVCSRTLLVSPTNSPVRLGVSPATTPTPTSVFNHRSEALFPCAGTLGCEVCLAPQLFLLVYLHLNVGPSTLPATSHCLASSLFHPAACLRPSYWSG